MGHMIADTVSELHDMAGRIGLKRAWFQPRSRPHYDACLSKRAEAVRLGAIELDRREFVETSKKITIANQSLDDAEGKVCEIIRRRSEWPDKEFQIVGIGLAYTDPVIALEKLREIGISPDPPKSEDLG